MGKNKAGRPSWFKLFIHQKALVDAVPDDVAGKALKAAFQYFETGEPPALDMMTGVVFAAFKPNIDAALDDFQKSVESGRSGGQKRWSKEDSPPIPSLGDPIGVPTEDRRQKKDDRRETIEERSERTEEKADKPPRTLFVPPTVADVMAYCQENSYQVDAERFIDYYESNGWKVGRNPMKDWKASVRSWARSQEQKDKSKVSGSRKGTGDKLLDMINSGVFDE